MFIFAFVCGLSDFICLFKANFFHLFVRQIRKTSRSPFAVVFITDIHVFASTVYMGSWFDHVREYCAAQEELDVHFVQFEEMLKVC